MIKSPYSLKTLKGYAILLITILCFSHMVYAAPSDSISDTTGRAMRSGHLPLISLNAGKSKQYNIAYLATPLLGGSLLMTIDDRRVKAIRDNYTPSFRYYYDDYIQYVPYAMQIGLKLGGLKNGYSIHMGNMFVADAIGAALTSGIVLGIKYGAGIMRPDGSSYNSFPSGHAATAFLGAQLLYHEYGERYPIVGGIGYGLATLTSVGRILNNRHWASDVMAGAAIGIFSAEIGYLLSDLIFGRKSQLGFGGDWGEGDQTAHSLSMRTHHAFGSLSLASDNGSKIDFSTSYHIGLAYNYRFASGWCIGGETNVGQRTYFLRTPEQASTTRGILKSMTLSIDGGYRWIPYTFLHIEPKLIAEYSLSKPDPQTIKDTDYRIQQLSPWGIGGRLSLGWHINRRFSIDTYAACRWGYRSYRLQQRAQPVRGHDLQPEIGTAFVLNL